MGANKCKGCGQWAGKHHQCPAHGPTRDFAVPLTPAHPVTDSGRQQAVQDRVSRAQAALRTRPAPAPVEVGTVARYDDNSRDTGEWARIHYRTPITPGVLDDTARFVFTNGQCHSMAAALSERTGWPVVGLIERTEYSYGGTNDAVRHLYVETPDGTWVDVNGEHEPQIEYADAKRDVEMPGGYGQHSVVMIRTDATGARGLATHAGSKRLDLDCEVPMLPTCMPVARSLVDQVLDQAGWADYANPANRTSA